MWLEAILSKDDVVRIVSELLPITIHLHDAEDKDTWLALFEPEDVKLVADAGLEITCKAKVSWPLLGFHVPITLHSLRVLLRPTVERRAGADILVFGLDLLHADFAGIPAAIDTKITEKIAEALHKTPLTWDFTDTLSIGVDLPPLLEPKTRFSLTVHGGQVKVTDDALGIAISFGSKIAKAIS